MLPERRPFKVKEEILLVEGMDKEKFEQFKDLITVYGDGKVNINTASEGVLKALGLEEELVGIIVRYRRNQTARIGKRALLMMEPWSALQISSRG